MSDDPNTPAKPEKTLGAKIQQRLNKIAATGALVGVLAGAQSVRAAQTTNAPPVPDNNASLNIGNSAGTPGVTNVAPPVVVVDEKDGAIMQGHWIPGGGNLTFVSQKITGDRGLPTNTPPFKISLPGDATRSRDWIPSRATQGNTDPLNKVTILFDQIAVTGHFSQQSGTNVFVAENITGPGIPSANAQAQTQVTQHDPAPLGGTSQPVAYPQTPAPAYQQAGAYPANTVYEQTPSGQYIPLMADAPAPLVVFYQGPGGFAVIEQPVFFGFSPFGSVCFSGGYGFDAGYGANVGCNYAYCGGSEQSFGQFCNSGGGNAWQSSQSGWNSNQQYGSNSRQENNFQSNNTRQSTGNGQNRNYSGHYVAPNQPVGVGSEFNRTPWREGNTSGIWQPGGNHFINPNQPIGVGTGFNHSPWPGANTTGGGGNNVRFVAPNQPVGVGVGFSNPTRVEQNPSGWAQHNSFLDQQTTRSERYTPTVRQNNTGGNQGPGAGGNGGAKRGGGGRGQ